ncbi:unnamed protein product [Phytophthora lilii]|uniref:Unnamed protein product n=1 Tax=Phytophthora lilii TaxID=2077276 RepID=A0A9W7D7N1_9STRA|nr:unnamed protein product [Phytophthora lilii]
MGTSALQLPALRQLHSVNQRVWTFVTCFMHSRRINTLFECQQAFLQHEGLRSFHELKLGNSFLHTEAVQQLYHSPIAMMNITTRDVLSSLRQFEEMIGHDAFRSSSHIDLNEFLQYLAQQYRQPSAQAMGVAIDPAGFGVYVGMLRRVANNEMKEIKTLEQQFQREVAEKMFRLTKEKFSDDNRKLALEELLEQTNARSAHHERDDQSQKTRGGKKSSMQSLSLDMLKRVTDVDVYLDNVLRRKAAADAKNQQKFRKPISSQEIAETDSKLRNQLTRFLVSSQKSKHHSRLKVVTWVICSIMAKTYALLLSDDKLPDEDSGADGNGSEAAKKISESDKEECDCCCVGKETCTCSCACKCHVESSDEEEEEEDGDQNKSIEDDDLEEKLKPPSNVDEFPVMPSDPFAARHAKLSQEAKVTLDEVKAEVERFLDSELSRDDDPRTSKDVLLVLSSLEQHLAKKFSIKTNSTSWAGRRSMLELLPDLLNDHEYAHEDDTGKRLHDLLRFRSESEPNASNVMCEKRLQEEVIPFVRECQAVILSSSSLSALSSEKQQQWIARRIMVEFGCARVEDLGFSNAGEISKIADNEPSEEQTSVIKYAGSLDLGQGDGDLIGAVAPVEETGESMQQKFLTEQALEKLRKCPYLIDVSLYMDWQERYAPLCGSLLSFIRVHEMILLDHAPSSNNFMFVSCLNGTILRVNEKSTPSDLELLLARAQQANTRVAASQVAVHLVSMVVTCKGRANFPKQLAQAHLRSYLSTFAKDKLAGNYPERFVLEVLVETPIEFAGFLLSLFIGVLSQTSSTGASNEWSIADEIWKVCSNDAERKVLLFVSSRISSPLWTNQTEKWCSLRDSVRAVCSETSTIRSISETENVAADSKPPRAIETASDSSADTSSIASLLDTSRPEITIANFSKELAAEYTEDTSPPASSTSADSCRLFIEDLRKKQFGVGLQIQDEATTSVLLIQQQRLERALKRLSDELYSESTHFVLELLQNADDNAYDDTVVPLGDFTLTADKEIIFYNNEQGFSPANIQAICDVGASTKASVDSEASIGKKGIGFKSVFKVSDDPQVHSNGFHICFHAKNSQHGNGMGYILPYWLEDTTQWKQRLGTTFVLPLNEASAQRADDISQSLMAFEPSILLFLRRIRELRLRDSVQQHTLHFLKKEKTLQASAQIVHLYSQVKKNENDAEMEQHNWLVVKEKLEPPQLFSRSHPTEIALALPLSVQSEDANAERPPLQQVFAYLPLRSYGFRFILQGDFEIPSSREAITNGSEWNEWLVSKFPKLVRTAVSIYISILGQGQKSDDRSNAAAAISHLLALLPLENEVQAPFRSIIPEIMRELRQVRWLACTPSITAPIGEFLTPVELIDCIELTGSEASESMTSLLEALSDDVLESTFKKRFLHPMFSRAMTASMKRQLRIEQLHSSHLMRVLSLSTEKNDMDWTVKILTLLAKLWRKDRHSNLLRQELRLIRCFPLQRKDKDSSIKWISLAEGHDALFVSTARENDSSSTRHKSHGFYGDLRILDDTFTEAISKSSKLRAFLLADVGIHVMEDHDLICHHILPKMAELCSLSASVSHNAKLSANFDTVIEYGKFIAFHLSSCKNCPIQADIRTDMVVATSGNYVVPVDGANLLVILPSTLKEMPQLVAWLKSKLEMLTEDADSFMIVSGKYFSDADDNSNSVDEQWQQLLVNVCELPLFDTKSLTSDARSQAGMDKLLQWIENEDGSAVKRSLSTSLARYLDKHWKANKDEDHGDGSESSSDIDMPGRFDMWRKYRWLEGSDEQFHRPTDLWLPIDTITRIFTPAMVVFSEMMWKNEDFSKRILGMKSIPTAADVLPVISRLSVDSTSVSTLDIDQMVRVYAFLWEESQRSEVCCDSITKTFTRKMMLFVPAEDDMPNRFISVKSAVWSSTSHNGELVTLETLYPKTLYKFFTEVCGVQRKPSVSFLCEMISNQQLGIKSCKSDSSDKLKAWKKKVLPLLTALSKKVKKGSLLKTETKVIKKTLKSIPWLPVRSVNGLSNGIVLCSSKDQPVLAATENELKLQKLMLSLGKEASTGTNESLKEHKKLKGEDDIKMVQLEASEDGGGGLQTLLNYAKVTTLTVHLEAHAGTWSRMLACFAKSSQLQNKKSKKKLVKLEELVIKAWASIFSADDAKLDSSVRRLTLFPTVDGKWGSADEMFINDQADLSKSELQQPGQTNQLPVLGLFSSNFFMDDRGGEDITIEADKVHKFLTKFCGMKSLKKHLKYEISVLTTQRTASAAFHEKIRSAFGLAQRFLFHSHRHLYDQLQHASIIKLAAELQSVLVDGHDGFQVVYRVGNLFSLRRSVDALSRCFLDISSSTLYIQSVSGDEEASSLSSVLMEISRKLFGAQVASNVANLLYLSLLQPSALTREQWLVETQLLPPLPVTEVAKLWVEEQTEEISSTPTSQKRTPEDMEDGEILAEDTASKKIYASSQQNYELAHDPPLPPFPPLPSSTNYGAAESGANYGMLMQRSQYPPLPQAPNGRADGPPYHPPLPPPPAGQAMQSLSMPNTMTKEEREAIGRWGEEYVFNQLKQQYADNESELTVEWVNEKEESGLPYDLTLSSAGKVVEYIEVKSTRTMEKGVFEISMNELDQAAIHGSTYSIYRVFNAGNPALCRVIRMKNPVSLVRQRKIQLALVMQ